MKRTFLLSILLLISSVFTLKSAQVSINAPYSMGFEAYGADSIEISNWVLNPGPQASACRDRWVIGSDAREIGLQSLYISCDTPPSASFGSRPCTQYVYRDFALPAGMYDISFDWYCEGGPGTYLAVGYALTTNNYLVANSSTGTIPAQVSPYLQFQQLNGTTDARWQNATFSFTSNGTRVYRIFFAWVNNNTDQTVQAIGACVDNIQMTSANCKRPTNITYNTITCDSIFVSWTGSSAEYELQYRQAGSNYWHKVIGIPGGVTSGTILEGMDESSYDLRVRGICAPDTSAWTYIQNITVYCPDNYCFNYLNLHDTSIVTCTYGSGYIGYNTNPECAYQNVGVIDYGSYNRFSRHTVNWDKTAYDPRTNNQLPLVPSGEYASIRLGNWQTGSEAESISYLYEVDSASALLIMKYAIVQQDPSHSIDGQPRFILDIIDDNGNLIDPICGHYDFSGFSSASGWITIGTGYDQVVFKPWTTIRLNLESYLGQTLQIRMTTYDCSYSGHYGYAYFTISCSEGQLRGITCGDYNVDHFQAPEGFNYRWYKASDPNVILGDSSYFAVDIQDTSVYNVDLISAPNYQCYYTLTADPNPLVPIAETSVSIDTTNQGFAVTCTNLSRIARINRVTGQKTIAQNQSSLSVFWDFGDGSPIVEDNSPVVTHTYSGLGGKFNITVYASMENGGCVDTFITQYYYLVQAEAEHGTVMGGGVYPEDSTITLQAVPDYGYHFIQWSDGNTNNPRTIVLTQDTSFTAEFAVDKTGACGHENQLTWLFEDATNTLFISGNGALDEHYTYGVEAPTQTTRLIIEEGVTAIGNSAFVGMCSTITSLSLPSTVTAIGDSAFFGLSSRQFNTLILPNDILIIGDYAFSGAAYLTTIHFGAALEDIDEGAFAGCRRVQKMTCLAEITPNVGTNALTSINSAATLYVPQDYLFEYQIDDNWNRFLLQPLGATGTTTEDSVTVEAHDNNAVFTWPVSDYAATYTIEITKDGVVFCTLIFNANGQLTGIAFAPSRSDDASLAPTAVLTANGWQFTVTGLNNGTEYGYMLAAKNAINTVIASYSGEFTTTGSPIATSLDEIGIESAPQKIYRNGQVLILRDGKVYTTIGAEVK